MKKFVNTNPFIQENWFTVFTGFLCGIAFVSFIIWVRLIRQVLPRDLNLTEVYSYTYWIVMLLLLYRILILFSIIYIKQRVYKGTTKPSIIQKCYTYIETRPLLHYIVIYIVSYILNAPTHIWDFLYLNLPRVYTAPIVRFYLKYGSYILALYPNDTSDNKRNVILTSILLNYIPQILLVSVFCFEILLTKHLDYFYYAVVLLMLSLIFTAFRRITAHVAAYETNFLYTEVFTIKEDEKHGTVFLPRDKIMPPELLIASIYNFEVFCALHNLSRTFFEIRDKYDWINNLIVSTIILFGLILWILIIYKLY